MTNTEFIEKAYRARGPKAWGGFSRPIFHNLAGILYGHRFDKAGYGGMIRHSEAGMLYLWAGKVPTEGTIVEIGCYGGLSTSYLALGSERGRARIYSVDPFDSDVDKQAQLTDHAVSLENKPSRQQVLEKLRENGLADRVELIEGYSQEVVKSWRRSIDFLWIDGNHDQAYRDFMDWSPFLTSGARVGFHDAHPRYGYPQVAEDVRKIFASDRWMRLEHVKSILTAVSRS